MQIVILDNHITRSGLDVEEILSVDDFVLLKQDSKSIIEKHVLVDRAAYFAVGDRYIGNASKLQAVLAERMIVAVDDYVSERDVVHGGSVVSDIKARVDNSVLDRCVAREERIRSRVHYCGNGCRYSHANGNANIRCRDIDVRTRG